MSDETLTGTPEPVGPGVSAEEAAAAALAQGGGEDVSLTDTVGRCKITVYGVGTSCYNLTYAYCQQVAANSHGSYEWTGGARCP